MSGQVQGKIAKNKPQKEKIQWSVVKKNGP